MKGWHACVLTLLSKGCLYERTGTGGAFPQSDDVRLNLVCLEVCLKVIAAHFSGIAGLA